jgi:hypothetical protein
MSRHVIDADLLPSRYEVVVGFDMVLDELFACVFDQIRAAAGDGGLVLGYKGSPRDLANLAFAVAAYATLPENFLKALDAECRGLDDEPARDSQLRLLFGGRNASAPLAGRVMRRNSTGRSAVVTRWGLTQD